uniref:Uncharacterized protein n=1 Tax=Cacopsylla melanoneura TaxID=428564 RepID=A0A8D8W8B4_9HEMI
MIWQSGRYSLADFGNFLLYIILYYRVSGLPYITIVTIHMNKHGNPRGYHTNIWSYAKSCDSSFIFDPCSMREFNPHGQHMSYIQETPGCDSGQLFQTFGHRKQGAVHLAAYRIFFNLRYSCSQRLCHTSSRCIPEVKQRQACILLGWVTTRAGIEPETSGLEDRSATSHPPSFKFVRCSSFGSTCLEPIIHVRIWKFFPSKCLNNWHTTSSF